MCFLLAIASAVYTSKPRTGITMISLKIKVPLARMTKPISDQGYHGCSLNKALSIQISTVREVSIVDRWAAEAYFVVAIPKLLKAAMEQIERTVSTIIIGRLIICWNP